MITSARDDKWDNGHISSHAPGYTADIASTPTDGPSELPPSNVLFFDLELTRFVLLL